MKTRLATPRISPRRRAGLDPRIRPIGVFDSGIGGLTVLKALSDLLPGEELVYLGDTARLPYGSKSRETITRYTRENVAFLLERGAKLVVVACNTASALALDEIQGEVPVPIVGVIEPGAAEALRVTRQGRIGVIGTEATIASGAYVRALRDQHPSVEVVTRACPLLVPLAEEGWVDNDVARRAIRTYLSALRRSGIDTLVLGCTHYPLLRPAIEEFLGAGVKVVDSARATARAVRDLLRHERLARPTAARSRAAPAEAGPSFFVTDAPERFVRIGEHFYGAAVSSALRVVLREDSPHDAPRRRAHP